MLLFLLDSSGMKLQVSKTGLVLEAWASVSNSGPFPYTVLP